MSAFDYVHPLLDPLLIGGGVALSASWWHRHAVRRPVAEVEPAPDPELEESLREYVWRTRVDGTRRLAGETGEGEGPLPGTWLEDMTDLPDNLDGWEAVIRLRSGKQTTRTAQAAADMVCSAYDLPAGSVVIEPTADRIQSKARVQVIHNSPLYDVHVWDPETMGISLGTGCSRIGTFADGLPTHLQWYIPGSGAANLLVIGAPGSGKSQFLSLMLGQAMRSRFVDRQGRVRPLVETWLGCGQAGQSFPDWTRCKALRWMATTPQEIVWMVHQFRANMLARSVYLTNLEWTDEQGRTRHGMSHWDPVASGLPMLQLVIDEAAAAIALNPDVAGWLLDIARMGRKNGCRIVLSTQSPSVDELGNNSNLRAMLTAFGAVVFRVGDGNHGSMAFQQGDVGDPSEIPSRTPDGREFQGAGFAIGPDQRGMAMMRTLKIDDPFGEAQAAEVVDPHPVDAAGGGRLMLEFWTRQEARWRGEDPEPAELARMAQEHADAQRAAFGEPSEGDGSGQGPEGREGAAQRPSGGSSVGPASPDARPSLRVLILDAVVAAGDRPATTAEIKQACAAWWSDRSVTNELGELSVDGGPLVKVKKGHYRRASARV